jgi:hypothetical protein
VQVVKPRRRLWHHAARVQANGVPDAQLRDQDSFFFRT